MQITSGSGYVRFASTPNPNAVPAAVAQKLQQLAAKAGKPYPSLLAEFLNKRTREEKRLNDELAGLTDKILADYERKIDERIGNPIKLNRGS